MIRCLHGMMVGLAATLTASAITPNAQELELANLIRNDSRQKRTEMVYHPALNFAARARANDLARRRYFAHVDPDGYGPNYVIYLTGYGMPTSWINPKNRNNVESVLAGALTAREAFDTWMGSPSHRTHIMAEDSFYATETRYGVGYAEVPGSPYTYYYVFLSARPPTNGLQISEPYREWLFSLYLPKQLDTLTDDSDLDGDGIPQIMEFALSYNPAAKETLSRPVFKSSPDRFEWVLPVRSDLGSVRAGVTRTTDFKTWTSEGVSRTGNVFTVLTQGNRGYLRFEATR